MIGRAFKHLWYTTIQYPIFLYGVWKLSRLPQPVVTVFGGKNITEDDPLYKKAAQLGQRCMDAGAAVITGGGSGIMEAAVCGTTNHKNIGKRLGITVIGVDEKYESKCTYQVIRLHGFALRKWLLIYFSSAFVIFPGGYGTLDECTEVLNLIKTKKIKRVPIVLIGKEYWNPLVDWLQSQPIACGYISQEYADLIMVTDSIDEAYEQIIKKE